MWGNTEETEKTTGGFGGGSQGFGSSGDSNNCFKCGESGHFSRECPTGRNSKGCFKCGEEGHQSRECPQNKDRPKGCYNCGDESHLSAECPEPPKPKTCFKCKEEGHMSRECPTNTGDEKPREIYVPPPPPEDEDSIFSSMEKGINFSRYNDIKVSMTGDNVPKTIQSFEEANLYPKVMENVRNSGYDVPTPIQKCALPAILSGRDVMACAQTGSGKTAAFLLPILTKMLNDGLHGSEFTDQEPAAIIVSPTRELTIQIYNEARKFSYKTLLRPVVVYGGTSVSHQLAELNRGTHMVVGTPGRLLHFISDGKIKLNKVKYLILDEADRMLDMGFEGEINKLVNQFHMPKDRITLMFSATFPQEIQKLAQKFLRDYLYITIGQLGGANTDICQMVIKTTNKEKRDKLVELLNESKNERVLVFVETKRNADFLASFLSQSEFPATSIHGDRMQREREEALSDFKTGKALILIATSVAARGLDIPKVQHVVNYDMPKFIEEYVHRIGRTGRCGNTGKSTCFFNPDHDSDQARALIKILGEAQQEVPKWLETMAEGSYGSGFIGGGEEKDNRDGGSWDNENNDDDNWD